MARPWRRCVLEMSMICHYCKESLNQHTVTADHVVPRSRGGRHDRTNLVPACGLCNNRKANMTGDEFVAWLATDVGDEWMRTRKEPRAPGNHRARYTERVVKTFMEDWLAWYEKTKKETTA